MEVQGKGKEKEDVADVLTQKDGCGWALNNLSASRFFAFQLLL